MSLLYQALVTMDTLLKTVITKTRKFLVKVGIDNCKSRMEKCHNLTVLKRNQALFQAIMSESISTN